ncbi:MAG: neutral/alkaline non-lysosomal ceramidase N-terminal domain-containing protein [Candidatus Omnitrophica bacterium]|nr:neutral/alkaline non-lysosomal ceramidase N-terminal domain-containing protein [Candidatus Omnitrophota bacterium]
MIKVGLAEKDITPPVGTPLAGNAREDYSSKGVYHRLYARAMVVDDGKKRVAIVLVDLIIVTSAMVKVCREKIKEVTGIKEEDIMIAATHTHSGPDVGELRIGHKVNNATLDMIQRGIAESAIEADRVRQHAKIGFGSGKEETIGHNRRFRLKDGTVHMNWEKIDPYKIDEILGPIDPEVGVIKIEDIGGRLLALFVNYTCHPAILAGDNDLISADYPGFFYEIIKERLGRGVLSIFANGAEGNINHIDPYNPEQKRGFEESKRLGEKLADSALRVCKDIKKMDTEITVFASREKLLIPRRKIPDERIKWAKHVLSKWDGKPITLVDGLPDEVYAQEALFLKERECEPVETEVQAFVIGDVALVGLPGEVFVEFGLEIKKFSPFAKTFIIGLANGLIGYVPTLRAFKEGGLESTPARHSQLTEVAGDMLVDSACRQLSMLKKK